MKMHILSGGRLKIKKSVYVPDADRQEMIELPVSCYLFRHEQGNVLFDTGCHPITATDAEARWGGMAKFMIPISQKQDNVIDQLYLLGMQADDIDLVVNSHFHSDHCGCNEFFKKATFICHQRELDAASSPDGANAGFLPIDWNHPPIETIDGQKDIFNDGRIVLLPMPGHTPGMVTALASLDHSGAIFLASDAVALRDNLVKDINPRNTADPVASSESMQEIRKIESSGATIIFGHDDAQWQTLKKGTAYYD